MIGRTHVSRRSLAGVTASVNDKSTPGQPMYRANFLSTLRGVNLPQPVRDVAISFLVEVDQRLPGRLKGLFLHGSICWGEFFPNSDIDFVALWDEVPAGPELRILRDAHEATNVLHPELVFDGFHCTSVDLARPPAHVAHRPVFYQSAFDPEGTLDINLVTWHELAERAISIRGDLPPIHTDMTSLMDFTRTNLDTYWRDAIKQIEAAGVEAVGENDPSIAQIGLGPARLHHLLSRMALTSKSGAGHYLRSLDPRWAKIAREAVRLRERPDTPSLYNNLAERGQDAYDQLTWIVRDGTSR